MFWRPFNDPLSDTLCYKPAKTFSVSPEVSVSTKYLIPCAAGRTGGIDRYRRSMCETGPSPHQPELTEGGMKLTSNKSSSDDQITPKTAIRMVDFQRFQPYIGVHFGYCRPQNSYCCSIRFWSIYDAVNCAIKPKH